MNRTPLFLGLALGLSGCGAKLVAYCTVPFRPQGFYSLVARVDAPGTITESDELDNGAATPFSITP